MKKRATALLLTVCIVISLIATNAFAAEGLTNFTKKNTYTPGQFTDVSASEWYADSVQTAFEFGLVKGDSATSFNPAGSVTLAETVTLAARLHSIYCGDNEKFIQGEVWYQTYVNYAIAKNIIKPGQFANFEEPATREEFAAILAAAFPKSALHIINNVTAIPDVTDGNPYKESILLLYKAGILTGNDEFGTFKPLSNIQRSEMATIITRMADKSARKNITLKQPMNVIEVSSADELLANIGSNVKIILKPGKYNLSEVKSTDNCFVGIQNEWSSTPSYTVYDVSDLIIEGDAEIVIDDIYADVLNFYNCSNVTLNGLRVGHSLSLADYYCEGAVTSFFDCSNISIENCELYGCGAIGIELGNTKNVNVTGSKIYDCSYSGMWLFNKSEATVRNTEFCDSTNEGGFIRSDNSSIECYDCNIHDINVPDYVGFVDTFDYDGPSTISFNGCTFTNNSFSYMTNYSSGKQVVFNNCSLINNKGVHTGENITYNDTTIKAKVTMYSLDGLSIAVWFDEVEDYQSKGWYLYPDYVCEMAERLFDADYENGIEYLEMIMSSEWGNTNVYQAKKDELLAKWSEAINCPVAIISGYVTTSDNSDPEACIWFRNLSDKSISGLKLTFTCLDANGFATTDYPELFNGKIDGTVDDIELQPGVSTSFIWNLNNNTQSVSVGDYYMTYVEFANGTYWKLK